MSTYREMTDSEREVLHGADCLGFSRSMRRLVSQNPTVRHTSQLQQQLRFQVTAFWRTCNSIHMGKDKKYKMNQCKDYYVGDEGLCLVQSLGSSLLPNEFSMRTSGHPKPRIS